MIHTQPSCIDIFFHMIPLCLDVVFGLFIIYSRCDMWLLHLCMIVLFLNVFFFFHDSFIHTGDCFSWFFCDFSPHVINFSIMILFTIQLLSYVKIFFPWFIYSLFYMIHFISCVCFFKICIYSQFINIFFYMAMMISPSYFTYFHMWKFWVIYFHMWFFFPWLIHFHVLSPHNLLFFKDSFIFT